MQLQSEIKYLKQMLIKMADQVKNNITDAVAFYTKKTEPIIINDKIVNQYEELIDEICFNLLIKERLFAKDLREVIAILKLVSDIERIGDHAEDIMEFSQKLEAIDIKNSENIHKMVQIALKMINDAILSFVNEDIELAKKTILLDDEVDRIYAKIVFDLTNFDKNAECAIPYIIYTTLIAKYIERIADHASNIAEWVSYMIDGSIFKNN